MTSFARFHNLPLNFYDVIGDVTRATEKSEITFFLKQQCSRLPKYLINKKLKFQLNMFFKMLLPWKHPRPHNQNSTTSSNCQINLRKSPMIWKDYLKLFEIAS